MRSLKQLALLASCSIVLSAQSHRTHLLGGNDPVVDINGPASSDHVPKEKRIKRNKFHNVGAGRELPEPSEAETFVGGGVATNPPLPVQQSDAIVVGKVTEATAHLSEAKDSVYTEFRVSVETILKNSSSSALVQGDVVDVERYGGAVRFRSGKVSHFRDYPEGFPDVGHKYVFFLKLHPDLGDFYIITGYELSNGKIVPLDGVIPPDSHSEFEQYRGFEQNRFLDLVRKTIGGESL